ncbi:MAG: (Fe-S)-binding protein [Acidimicrobiia bacterium]|nr:(Fe-S)-binding protein [Acidimicrobiia bacterium]
MPFTTPLAPTGPELDACIHCGLCLPHCPTFRLTGDEAASPRGRLAAMSAVKDGIAGIDATFEEMMGFCLGCRACEAVCPSLVPYGRALEGARAEVAAAGRGSRLRRLLLGRILPLRWVVRLVTLGATLLQRLAATRWLPGRLGRGLAGLRSLRWRRSSTIGTDLAAVGEEIGTAALLAGCVMDPWFADVHGATITVLRRAGYRVVVPEGQTCCGALAAHDGAADAAARLARRTVAAFAGADLVVADAAGCGAHLKDYEHWAAGGDEFAGRVRDVTEVVAEAIHDGRLPTFEGAEPVAVQDPCHLRHAQRVTAAPRTVVSAAGHPVVELDPDGICCGAAGVYSMLRPGTADQLGTRKADIVRSRGVATVASANPGCEMQLRSHLDADHEVVHPVELYARALTAGRATRRTALG